MVLVCSRRCFFFEISAFVPDVRSCWVLSVAWGDRAGDRHRRIPTAVVGGDESYGARGRAQTGLARVEAAESNPTTRVSVGL